MKAHKVEKENINKFVFYHGCSKEVGFYLDIVKEFRDQLAQESGGGIKLLRAFDNQFSAKNILEMLLHEAELQGIKDLQKINNYREGFSKKALATNFSLVGSPLDPASSTYYLFHQSMSVSAPGRDWLFSEITSKLGSPGSADVYNKIYNRYFPKDRGNGRLLQIFVDPSVVDDLSYLCLSQGKLPFESTADDLKTNLRFKPSAILKELRINAGQISEESDPELAHLQARLYLKPELFWDPNKVTIKSYWRQEFGQEKYSKELKAQVKLDLANWLKNRERLDSETFFSSKIPLQEAYRIAYEQVNGKGTYAQKDSLDRILNQDNADDFKAFMRNPKFDINIELPGPDKKIHSLLEIAMISNAHKITHLIFEQLINNKIIQIAALEDLKKLTSGNLASLKKWVAISKILKDLDAQQ